MGRTGLLLALCGSSKNPSPPPPPVDRCPEVVGFFKDIEEDGSGEADFREIRLFVVAKSVEEKTIDDAACDSFFSFPCDIVMSAEGGVFFEVMKF